MINERNCKKPETSIEFMLLGRRFIAGFKCKKKKSDKTLKKKKVNKSRPIASLIVSVVNLTRNSRWNASIEVTTWMDGELISSVWTWKVDRCNYMELEVINRQMNVLLFQIAEQLSVTFSIRSSLSYSAFSLITWTSQSKWYALNIE